MPLHSSSDPSDSSPWQAAAACAGLSPAVVFARRARQAAPALRACAVCTVRRECERAVAPADSWFDGVCAGRLWRNGRPVPLSRTAGSLAAGTTGSLTGTRTTGSDTDTARTAGSVAAPPSPGADAAARTTKSLTDTGTTGSTAARTTGSDTDTARAAGSVTATDRTAGSAAARTPGSAVPDSASAFTSA
ncbi:hypothetical protein ACIBCM_19415 [Streptomyces sp. NPDC051018]|uniref:hypothetical protein n=1 Tax=Streptomyces sp. NPDC051018 TaxID=3365639 RepID=UPI00379B464E